VAYGVEGIANEDASAFRMVVIKPGASGNCARFFVDYFESPLAFDGTFKEAAEDAFLPPIRLWVLFPDFRIGRHGIERIEV